MTKLKLKTTLFIVVAPCALCLLAGCRTWFDPPVAVHSPNGWVPPTDVVINEPIMRPIRAADNLLIRLRAGTAISLDMDGIVDDFGNITLQHLGDFRVQHMNTTEAAHAIKNAYEEKGYFVDATVSVILVEAQIPDEIFLDGQITRRGNMQFREGLTLRQAIIAAGGPTPFAKDTVTITRGGKTTKHSLRRIQNLSEADPVLRPKDIIYIEERWL